MRSYNTSLHSGIGTTPLSRYQQTRASIRTPASREWLEECFLNRITRKVNIVPNYYSEGDLRILPSPSTRYPMTSLCSLSHQKWRSASSRMTCPPPSSFTKGCIIPSALRIRMRTAGRSATIHLASTTQS